MLTPRPTGNSAESHNAAFRMILERVIDEKAVIDARAMDLAILSALHAKNSHVKQAGRTAYQAAFGRVPRIPGELLDHTESSPATWEATSRSQALAMAERGVSCGRHPCHCSGRGRQGAPCGD